MHRKYFDENKNDEPEMFYMLRKLLRRIDSYGNKI